MSNIYSNPIDTAFRLLLVLQNHETDNLTEMRLLSLDFIATFGRSFQISQSSLHGESPLNLAELPARKALVHKALQYLVTHDLVRVFDTKLGFGFVINEAGKRLVNALESRYAIEYSAAIQTAEHKYSAMTDEELMVMVQEQWQLQEEVNR
jgi:hypothetical protein